MIKVNGQAIIIDHFGDGTLKCDAVDDAILSGRNVNVIEWMYDNESELFAVMCLARDIQQRFPDARLGLCMPYIPNARQDRRVSGRLFTLETFAELINLMNFSFVSVLDPHSEESEKHIERLDKMISPRLELEVMTAASSPNTMVMFPDAGAEKKYRMQSTAIVGKKTRDESGRISSYELVNFVDGTENVLIRDDICSYGGTFVAAAKALRERGVKNIKLLVSHCEDNILKGEVFDYIDEVITTDTICKVKHPKLRIVDRFR